ncbi:hypothetical protein CN270_12015 [Priestia megaterium]|uniref:helix-turn-helix domain-containing protein n=1 Tax=Priestia megaterium TaxID=1404 RepID=UPI000BF81AA1|nr:helix-turn-helix domain-containing protein [Priestia megaterium]PFE33655.1 hypothetical protein CN270_12015 [Priestia megaterium]
MENNFTSKIKQPWTTYDNLLIQEETTFKNANQKLCYMYLYSYANASKIFPSMDAIAKAICSTRRTAMTIIQQLEEMGFIEVKRTPGKSNHYILNDYFEVIESRSLTEVTGEKNSPVKNFHHTSEKNSPVPVKNFHPKTKTKKLKTKNKISSSSNRDLIDNNLREKYTDVPFDDIKNEMLSDAVTVETDKQYKSLLEYRLKHWKPKHSKKKRITRKENIPEWLNNENKVGINSISTSDDFEIEKAKLKDELLKLDEELRAGNRQ